MPFNEGQLKAIMQRNSSILVSAPAGSGKTKILVSRIIELLKEGYNISNFLVLTFTEAAGNEMKQRLSDELNKLVVSDIDNDLSIHLNEQLLNLPNAYITNFHGFCNLLLMKYGYLINVLPGFSINSDPLAIKKEVLKECEEQWVKDPLYKDFFSLYFHDYQFDEFEDVLLSIDELSHSIDGFYDFVEKIYHVDYQISSINDWNLFPALKHLFYNECQMAMNKLVELRYYCETQQLSDFYERPDDQSEKNQLLMIPFDSLYDYIDERIQTLEHPITYDTLVSLLNDKPLKAYNMNWKEVDEVVKKTFNKMKRDVLDSYNKAISSYIDINEKEFIEKLNISYQAIQILIGKNGLLDRFQLAYNQRKRELNQLDFSDLERYAHQLLKPQYGIVEKLHDSLKEIMVDEYQDTNQIQESLLLKISEAKNPHIPLFMVGDMKQSIYRFRQADPQIFLNKYNQYSLSDEDCLKTKTRRIDLVYNYRSSKVVLDSINYIFNAIMDKDIGGLEYYLDESARLNYDYDGKEQGKKEEARKRFFHDKHLETEVLIDIYDPQDELDKEQYEAHMCAQRIASLKEESQSFSFNDIAVLMRSTTSFITFKKVFDQYHIPTHIVLSQGLLNSNEIISMISFLKAINNPYDDISLLSVLRLPYSFSHIDMNEIAKLRIDHKNIPLYECLKESSSPQIVQFLEYFEELKLYSYQHSPYELILKIDELTDYKLFVSNLNNGAQRKANLDLFFEIIKQLQSAHPYLNDLIYTLENSSDYAPGASSSNDEAVEFMTIHKSKGLEFPIVFVCNMHKRFNMQDSKEKLMIDKQLGFALKPRLYKNIDNINNIIIEYDNVYRNMIAKYQTKASIDEEMRILYVALTRASSKLILTGVIKDIDEIIDIQQKLLVNECEDIYKRKGAKDVLLYNRLRETNNYLSWILAAILRHPSIIEQCLSIPKLKDKAMLLKQYHFEKRLTFDSTEHAMFSLQLTDDKTLESLIPHYHHIDQLVNDEYQQYYSHYKYPYDLNKPKTLAVTALTHTKDDHYIHVDEDDNQVIKASDKGTLVHLLMSYLSFNNDNVQQIIENMFNESLIDETGKEVLIDYKDNIESFIKGPYYQMISQSDYIYKEKSFSYFDKSLNQIIHGIFDLVFIKDNQVYVLDYKTDRVQQSTSNTILIQKHQIQLDYYKKVLKEMYGKEVQAIVYYLHISKGVEF